VLYVYSKSAMSTRLLQNILSAADGDVKACFVNVIKEQVDAVMEKQISIRQI
jgi:hypothetical protein